MKPLRVASVQFQHVPSNKAANLETIGHFVRAAAERDVQIILFPECCISGYWHLRNLSREELVDLAEPVFDGLASLTLLELAVSNNLTVSAGLVEIAEDGRLFNTQIVAMPDGKMVRHRKLHCFINENMSSGNDFTVFDTPHGCRVGLLICYDNNIVENVRATALAGAEVLLAPHQTGGCKSMSPFAMGVVDRQLWDSRHTNPDAIEAEICGDKGRKWLMRWLPSRAHDNGMFLVFSNGIGPDDDEIRTGNAMILDPYGRILVETCRAANDMIVADLDPSLRDRCTGARWIKARRPELYGSLAVRSGNEKDTRVVRFESWE
ncbi:nitrilase family protein [Bythopirellula goksoeyrii]|uniref:(R)-stereoselective amidase n=1 Tax=Bythopirellula goksoeyrii TaxID=1400387 RepID=A0A5B9QB82_9BACT|nr:nitrilase family protein [Bythopirellula goksoeyrii]QEG36297.1 (R)-stereoselective amidase [Bythopirellula goksoeyrii]